MEKLTQARGKLAIQSLAMPANTNPNGDIFGGWLVSQMDLAGGVIAKARAKGRITTVAIDAMVFHHPVQVGDLVSCYGEITRVGRTSIAIHIEVWAISENQEKPHLVTDGVFTYVAINAQGRPRPV
jgi:acyl-CoA thioesterase YciA